MMKKQLQPQKDYVPPILKTVFDMFTEVHLRKGYL